MSEGGMESATRQALSIGNIRPNGQHRSMECCGHFQMPLHYPRYTRTEYETMPEWRLDYLLKEYGLPVDVCNVEQKRKFAMGAFLWTH